MRRVTVLALTAFAVLAGGNPVAHAGSSPPPPPTPPPCNWCGGPPPAPTPVPTLAPIVVAPDTHSVAVEISPTKVRRGGRTQVAVMAKADDRVTMAFQYVHGKPSAYRATIGRSGKLVKRWNVAKTAPIGKATIRIHVTGDGKEYKTLVSFSVTK